MLTVTMDLVATGSKIPTHFFRNPSTPNTGVANRERVPEDSCKFTTPDIRYFFDCCVVLTTKPAGRRTGINYKRPL